MRKEVLFHVKYWEEFLKVLEIKSKKYQERKREFKEWVLMRKTKSYLCLFRKGISASLKEVIILKMREIRSICRIDGKIIANRQINRWDSIWWADKKKRTKSDKTYCKDRWVKIADLTQFKKFKATVLNSTERMHCLLKRKKKMSAWLMKLKKDGHHPSNQDFILVSLPQHL